MKIRTARDIGILIKEARTRQGLSQAALARMINTTQTWISWVENGKPSAEIGNVLLALTTLGVELDFQIPSAPTSAAGHHQNADEPHVDDDDLEPPYKL
ncbi:MULTISPECIES: helix-turn-helix transcriptional regulator [Hyphomicrobiales]|jgi:y4mF family transcriptional regulator|uniref:helix-turn-helix transcriptional regulator n=1 Tax=Hyphomicrobiales TaxID=356 RepID=UPI00058E7FD5|nr:MULTISPECIES: helix-turn-helix transcriptional regulator [Phyllobacteriaceae]MCX8570836.1 helix-turn-helix transcriptional regulator [Aminobacter sp. MET-1]